MEISSEHVSVASPIALIGESQVVSGSCTNYFLYQNESKPLGYRVIARVNQVHTSYYSHSLGFHAVLSKLFSNSCLWTGSLKAPYCYFSLLVHLWNCHFSGNLPFKFYLFSEGWYEVLWPNEMYSEGGLIRCMRSCTHCLVTPTKTISLIPSEKLTL